MEKKLNNMVAFAIPKINAICETTVKTLESTVVTISDGITLDPSDINTAHTSTSVEAINNLEKHINSLHSTQPKTENSSTSNSVKIVGYITIIIVLLIAASFFKRDSGYRGSPVHFTYQLSNLNDQYAKQPPPPIICTRKSKQNIDPKCLKSLVGGSG